MEIALHTEIVDYTSKYGIRVSTMDKILDAAANYGSPQHHLSVSLGGSPCRTMGILGAMRSDPSSKSVRVHDKAHPPFSSTVLFLINQAI